MISFLYLFIILFPYHKPIIYTAYQFKRSFWDTINIKRTDSNTFYELRIQATRSYEKEGIYFSFEKAYAAGVNENVPFNIEKCKFTDCTENYADEYIGMAIYTSAGDLLGCIGNSDPVKKAPDGRKNIENR